MPRTYDPKLADIIAEKAHVIDVDGLKLEIRPIPDDDREHVVDPRVYDYAMSKINAPKDPNAKVPDFMDNRKTFSKPTCPFDEGTCEHELVMADLGDRWLPTHVYTPASHEPGSPCLIYIHGGGFINGLVEKYENSLRYLADISGAIVLYPEVRMAPECPFPGPVDDADNMVDWAIDHADELGIDPKKIGLAGDSAGGSLVCAAAIRQAAKGNVALLIHFYALVDATPEQWDYWSYDLYPVIEEHAQAARNRIDRIKNAGDAAMIYVLNDKKKLYDPLVSAICTENMAVFPRTVVVSSEYDYLRVQVERLGKKMQDAGCDVRVIRYLGMDHGFFENGGTAPQAEDLCRVIAEELAKL